ncbi:MAG: RDD family protein [Gammaproteobacteria bacterium]|jgi:uncharacterized RDD family membrane protein YckC
MDEHITITSVGGVEVKLDLVALGGRSYAFVIDWHIRFLAALTYYLVGTYFFSGGFHFVLGSLAKAQMTTYYFAIVLPAMLIYFLYHPVLEVTMQGHTPGKRMAGIRIVGKDGRSASAGALLLRNVFRLIDSLPIFYVLGIIVCLINKQHLRIGDMAAGTVLIYDEKASEKRLRLIMGQEISHALSTQQRELIAELLERWNELEAGKRRAFAREILVKFGLPLPGGRRQALDNALQGSLQQLLK